MNIDKVLAERNDPIDVKVSGGSMQIAMLSSKRAIALIGIVLSVSGCASSDRPWATQPPTAPEIQLPQNSPLRAAFQAGAITRAASAGKNFFCNGGFDNWAQETRRSFDQFLRVDGFLAESNPRYEINLRLVAYDTSTGLTAEKTTQTSIQYEVIEVAHQKVVMGDTVTTTYIAKTGDAFDGCVRERLSASGSTNDGIRTILTRLLSLR